MKDFIFIIIVLLCCLQFSFAKTYLLIGLAGCGKSTTGNALINKSGDQKLLSIPFKTCDGASACTSNSEVEEGKDIKIMDTIGFGDPKISVEDKLVNLRKGFISMNNRLNGIIFVVKGGRISNEMVNFLKSLQNLFDDKFKPNSILLLTHTREGWVKEQSDANLREAIDNCNGKYFEFNLKFDDDYDDVEDREKNLKKRGNTVDKLVKFLEKQNFNEIDLSFFHEKEFEITWSSIIYEIFWFIIDPISVVFDLIYSLRFFILWLLLLSYTIYKNDLFYFDMLFR